MAEKKVTKEEIKDKEKDYKYSKEQFLNATKPIGNVDALYVVLKDGELYTKEQAKKLLEDFLKKKIEDTKENGVK